MSNKGALIAAMAAGLFSAGAPVLANAADSDKVHCEGVNACKGMSRDTFGSDRVVPGDHRSTISG